MAASKNKMKLVSNFSEAKHASHEITQLAISQAVLAGKNKSDDRLEKNDLAKGYDLPVDTQDEVKPMYGRIFYDHWYGHFFEYGTVHIPAIPFIRPAHREMRKIFRAVMDTQFEGWVRRRAGVRR